jgi:hypothetical protein
MGERGSSFGLQETPIKLAVGKMDIVFIKSAKIFYAVQPLRGFVIPLKQRVLLRESIRTFLTNTIPSLFPPWSKMTNGNVGSFDLPRGPEYMLEIKSTWDTF